MKRVIPFVLAALLLCGCSFRHNDTAPFYYRRAEFAYNSGSPVIVSEEREITGHWQDLSYLISLYLLGPVDSRLVSPFPAGTRLVSLMWEDNTLTIELTDTGRSLSDSGFSLACACLTQTIQDIVPGKTIIVSSGSRALATAPADLLLTDNAIPKGSEP